MKLAYLSEAFLPFAWIFINAALKRRNSVIPLSEEIRKIRKDLSQGELCDSADALQHFKSIYRKFSNQNLIRIYFLSLKKSTTSKHFLPTFRAKHKKQFSPQYILTICILLSTSIKSLNIFKHISLGGPKNILSIFSVMHLMQ